MIFVSLNSKTTVVTKGIGIAYSFRAHSFAPFFCEVRASQSFFMYSVLSTMFSFYIFLKTIRLSVLRFTATALYPFGIFLLPGIFKLFFQIYDDQLLLCGI